MKKFLPLLLLAGCTTSNQLTLPDGSSGYAITCNGYSCFAEAGKLCHGGYDVLARDERQGWMLVNANYYGSTESRDMLVRCAK